MKKRWLVNLILLAVVAGLVAFLYLRPKADAEQSTMHDLSSYKLAEFNADQASVQRILSIIAAQSSDKISGGDMAKFGLN